MTLLQKEVFGELVRVLDDEGLSLEARKEGMAGQAWMVFEASSRAIAVDEWGEIWMRLRVRWKMASIGISARRLHG